MKPDLGNLIDKWQAPAGVPEQHSANNSFQNRYTRKGKEKSEDVHMSADGLPRKRLSQQKQTYVQKKLIHDCTFTKLKNIKNRDSDSWKYLLISNILLRLNDIDPC